MKKPLITIFALLAVMGSAIAADLNYIDSMSIVRDANGKNGDKKALFTVAKQILAAPDTEQDTKSKYRWFVRDPWGAALLLNESALKGYKPAENLLVEQHKSWGNACIYLLNTMMETCENEMTRCTFVSQGGYELAKIWTGYTGCAYESEPGYAPRYGDAYMNNGFEGMMDLSVCIDSIKALQTKLVNQIAQKAGEIDPQALFDLYMGLDADNQNILAPSLPKEVAVKIGNKYLSERNFVLARFWFKKADNAEGLAEIEKKEKEIAEFAEASKKAKEEVLASREEERKKALADEVAKREAEIKEETARKAADQKAALERQAAEQKLELQRQESEKQLAHESQVAQRKMAEEKATVVAESQRKYVDGLKSGSVAVANLDDAIVKYDAQNGGQIVAKPPMTAVEGYYYLRGRLTSIEKIEGQSGNVYMCETSSGPFAFVTDKKVAHLSINQTVGIVGQHLTTEEGTHQSQFGAKTKIYIPIFNASEVLGD